MKKVGWWIGGLILTLIVFSLFLPRKTVTRSSRLVNSPYEAITRWTVNPTNWKAWWPGQVLNDSTIQLKNNQYRIEIILLNGFRALRNDQMERIEFQFLASTGDSTQLNLTRTLAAGWNPIVRIYQWGKQLLRRSGTDPLLDNVASYFDKTENIYGFGIKRGKVIHVSWMSAKKIYDHHPTIEETYSLLDGLKSYIESQNGAIQAEPILHLRSVENNQLELMVAYPTDRDLKPNAIYSPKQMIPGFLMIGEVTGGPKTIELAEQNLEFFISDHKLQSPAIPFQTLITDRSKITDTSKWVTRLNYPVFN